VDPYSALSKPLNKLHQTDSSYLVVKTALRDLDVIHSRVTFIL